MLFRIRYRISFLLADKNIFLMANDNIDTNPITSAKPDSLFKDLKDIWTKSNPRDFGSDPCLGI